MNQVQINALKAYVKAGIELAQARHYDHDHDEGSSSRCVDEELKLATADKNLDEACGNAFPVKHGSFFDPASGNMMLVEDGQIVEQCQTR